MLVATATLTFYAPWVHSLKEKRMELQRILARAQNKFHCSAAELDCQDIHQTIVVGFAQIAANPAQADSMIDQLINFCENITEAQLTKVERELLSSGG